MGEGLGSHGTGCVPWASVWRQEPVAQTLRFAQGQGSCRGYHLLAMTRREQVFQQPAKTRDGARDQQGPAGPDLTSTLKRLYAEKRWDQIAQLAPVSPTSPAELDYYRGMALARLERWQEAKEAFESGRRKEPSDKRFPLELAGVAFKQKHYSEAKTDLERALHLDPRDRYAVDFLATIYFLEGNLEAALVYWNRIDKPAIDEVKTDPQLRVDPVLLDRAFAFSPASVLRLDDLRTTQARIERLGIFPRYRFELSAKEDEKFDVRFRSKERNGWGSSKAQALLSLLRGVPYQTIYPEWYNLRHSATNFLSLARWDAEKRRAFAELSGPLARNPKWRYRFSADARDENWDLSTTLYGSGSPPSGLKVRNVEAGAGIESVESGRWSWRTGLDLSDREFGNLGPTTSQSRPFFTDGFALKYGAGLDAHVLRIPTKRLTLDSGASGQLGKMVVRSFDPFAKVESTVTAHWLPESRGDDYETTARFRAGKTFGQTPLDELFILGLERDNDLWLRAHIGTRAGRKGSAPLGRDYILFNWDTDKRIYENGFVQVKLGPFLDSGRAYDASQSFGSKVWLWDGGGQLKARILGGPSVVFCYGKDLRSGHNAFYVTVSRN